MKELIDKAKTLTRGHKHVDAKTALLQTVFPLFEVMWRQFEEMATNVDHNFQGIYETLAISNDGAFLDNTEQLVTELNQFVDRILLAAGFFVKNPDGEGFLPTESMPQEVAEKLAELTSMGFSWFQQLEAVRLAADEDSLDDDEDDDEDDEDDVSYAASDDDDDDDDDDEEDYDFYKKEYRAGNENTKESNDSDEANADDDVMPPPTSEETKQEAPNA